MDELRKLLIFEGLPDEELQWIVDHSHEQSLNTGDMFFKEGEPIEYFYVTLEGELKVTRIFNGKETVMGTTPAGVIGGELAILNNIPSMINSQAIMPTRLLLLTVDDFRHIFAACPVFGGRIFKVASERTQGYVQNIAQREKMTALGKLSAGLAHELNNPAAAARRASTTLRETLPTLQAWTMKLNGLGLNEAQMRQLTQFQEQTLQSAVNLPPLNAVEQGDLEDEMGDWLDEQGLDDGWEMASTFVSVGLTVDALTELTASLPQRDLGDILHWLCESFNTIGLLEEIEHSTERIANLVKAVKEYTYMDQAPVQAVDLNKGLESTLTVLKYKLRDITVVRQYDPNLPVIQGRGGELNQVWTNIIVNAIEAMEGRGELKLITRCEQNFAMVEITDNGPGIPPQVKPHLFEPFFTTKGVGEGTGLGLDISYRIVGQHNGTIEVQSQPGETRFIVRLPSE